MSHGTGLSPNLVTPKKHSENIEHDAEISKYEWRLEAGEREMSETESSMAS